MSAWIRRGSVILLTMLLFLTAAVAENAQTPILIDGVRVAFFDADGNLLTPKAENGLLYVPLQAFCENMGLSAEVQGQSVAEGFAERGVDRKLNGLYYFASIAILARCDHLIAGKTMATQFIRTMRDTPFETEFYWDLGRYGVDDVGKRGM